MEKEDVLKAVYPKIEATALLKSVWSRIEANSDKELAEVMFLIFIYLFEQTVAISQSGKDETAKKKALVELADTLRATFTRQILHESQASLNSAGIINFFKSGYETLLFMVPQVGPTELDEFVNDVFVSDKGYPRSVNFVQNYMPFNKRTLEWVINDFLDGFGNTNLFTGGKDERSRREQLVGGWATKDQKGKREAWGRIVGHIAQKMHLPWEKTPVKSFLEKNEMKLVNALRDVIPVTDSKVFMVKDFKIVAEKLYMED